MGLFTPNVKKLKNKGDIEGLVGLLGHHNETVRIGAQAAIEDLRDPRSVDVLVNALRGPSAATLQEWERREAAGTATRWEWVRRESAGNILAEVGDPRAVDLLVAALEDPDPDMRAPAAKVLGKLGDPRALEPLIATLDDPNGEVRSAAVGALDDLDDPRAIQPLARMSEGSARDALRRFGPRAVAVLQGALTGDSLTDLPALRALASPLGDKRGIDGLLAIVQDASLDDDTRSETAIFLRRHGGTGSKFRPIIEAALHAFRSDRASLRFLIDEFRGYDRDLVVRAGSALAERGDEALEPLLLAMQDHDMLARYRAVRPMTHDEAKGLMLELTARRLASLSL
jgi:HEAT repeat protein